MLYCCTHMATVGIERLICITAAYLWLGICLLLILQRHPILGIVEKLWYPVTGNQLSVGIRDQFFSSVQNLPFWACDVGKGRAISRSVWCMGTWAPFGRPSRNSWKLEGPSKSAGGSLTFSSPPCIPFIVISS